MRPLRGEEKKKKEEEREETAGQKYNGRAAIKMHLWTNAR